MAKTAYQTIDQYHEAHSGETLDRMQKIRAMVHQVAPEATEVISYQIPAFKLDDKYHLIYYSAYAKHITISSVWTEAMLQELKDDLKAYKISKSAIQLPLNQPFQFNLIQKILAFRKAEFEAKKK